MTTEDPPIQEAAAPDFNIFVGAETGVLKGVSINAKMYLTKNFANLHNLERQHEITAMAWGDEEDQSEILLGLRNQIVKVFDPADKSYSSNIEHCGGSGKLVGVAKVDDNIVTATESGLVQVWREPKLKFDTIDYELCQSGKLKKDNFENEEARAKHMATLRSGRSLCRMRKCPQKNEGLIATGGKENELQVWDLNKSDAGPMFTSKNVPLDSLQLRVPVWITDMCFPDNSTTNTIAITSRHGHLRLYDTRGQQRRPVIGLEWKDEVLTAIGSTPVAEDVLVGTAAGHLALYDLRMTHKGMKRKYRGFTGGIRSIDCMKDKNFFAAVGLDRFLRIFDINQPKSVQKMYLKARLSHVLMTKEFDPNNMTKQLDRKERRALEIANKKPTNAQDPEVITVKEDGDEFWSKLTVIREKKKGKKSKASSAGDTDSSVKAKRKKN